MQEIVIKNVKNEDYKEVNINQLYDPNVEHKESFEFQKSNVVSPFKCKEGKLNINFYTLQPGKSNYPYHSHFGREEVIYIISGTATLKTPKGDIEVSEGDVISLPTNEQGAHMLTNHTTEPVTYLDVDTVCDSDVILYPNSGNVRIMVDGMQKSFKMESEVNYLDGE